METNQLEIEVIKSKKKVKKKLTKVYHKFTISASVLDVS